MEMDQFLIPQISKSDVTSFSSMPTVSSRDLPSCRAQDQENIIKEFQYLMQTKALDMLTNHDEILQRLQCIEERAQEKNVDSVIDLIEFDKLKTLLKGLQDLNSDPKESRKHLPIPEDTDLLHLFSQKLSNNCFLVCPYKWGVGFNPEPWWELPATPLSTKFSDYKSVLQSVGYSQVVHRVNQIVMSKQENQEQRDFSVVSNILLGVALLMLVFNYDDFGMLFYNNWVSLICFTLAIFLKIIQFSMDMSTQAMDKQTETRLTIKSISAYFESLNEEIEADFTLARKHKWMIHLQSDEQGDRLDYLELKLDNRRPVNVEVHSLQ